VTPFPPVGTEQLDALRQLAKTFNTNINTAPSKPPFKNTPEDATLPRVGSKSPNQHPHNTQSFNLHPPNNTHRYLTQQNITRLQEQAHHITTIQDNDILTINMPITKWANAIIDPDTGAAI
jgi:hypothetical protein